MNKKERIIWISSLAIVLAVSLFAVLQYQTKLSYTELEKASLSNDNTKLMQENGDCATQVAELRGETEKLKLLNYDKTMMQELQREGFTGQLKDIVADLKKHS